MSDFGNLPNHLVPFPDKIFPVSCKVSQTPEKKDDVQAYKPTKERERKRKERGENKDRWGSQKSKF